MSSIRISHLTKSFGARRALDDISLEIESGEMVALIGASGSGKSTLLRHVSGLTLGDAASSGSVQVGGRTVQSGGRLAFDARELRARTGFIFQQFNLVGRMPVITNVLAGLLHRVPAWRSLMRRFEKHEIERAMEALGRVDMADQAWQRASTLSGGQQQRAAIARTLVQGSKAILADEPIASLDPESSRRVMEILANINREDRCTVVVSLHQVQVAMKYCPRTIALHQGRIAFDGPSSFLTADRLRGIYGADVEELFEPQPEARPALPVASLHEFPAYQPAGERLIAAARMCA